MLASFPFAHNIAITTGSVSAASATAVLVTQEKIVLFDHAPTTAMETDAAMRTTPVIAPLVGLALIARCKLAPRSAPETVFATMALASASLDSPEFTALSLHARLLALATESAFQLATR
jgi:alpha-ketoglutarate-dependent taurine dioxygenase